MKQVNTAIAIVMGRGGSKRVPRKNVRPFCGKPMICWPVEHAVKSGLFQDIMVSTDDTDIAKTAQHSGASFYSLRSAKFSDDHTTTPDVLRYELEEYEKRKKKLPELCCCLYGTSALATASILTTAMRILRKTQAQLVMAVTRYSHPIERSLQFDTSGIIHYRHPEFVPVRTQDITPSYHDIGLFYIFDTHSFMKAGGNSFVPLTKTAIEVPIHTAVDIDTEEDWELAELLAQKNKLGMCI